MDDGGFEREAGSSEGSSDTPDVVADARREGEASVDAEPGAETGADAAPDARTDGGPPASPLGGQEGYIKASNTRTLALFGSGVALSADGNTLAVGSPRESSNAIGINGNQADTSAPNAGAVYVFTRSGATWSQQAYLKASNTRSEALFGVHLTLSADGTTLAVGAIGESSNATGVNGSEADTGTRGAGATYVFVRTGTLWSQQAYLKASNTRRDATFGSRLALSANGDTLAVGAVNDSSNATGINGNQADTSMASSGAVYVFARGGTSWSQQAYVKASNTRANTQFSTGVALSGDGDTLAVGSSGESSNATGINGNQTNTSAGGAGAAYVFVRNGTGWAQQAYVKASNARSTSVFGSSVALSRDGHTLAVGAYNDSSNAVGVDGNQTNRSAIGAGAAYVFTRRGTTWSQQAYIKASNTSADTRFGHAAALSEDGHTLAIGSPLERSSATGINGVQTDDGLLGAGAVYLFARSGAAWSQGAYIKASNTQGNANFGTSLALSGNGTTLAIPGYRESSNATGIGGDQTDTSAPEAGAVYVFR